jgi:hypothetical protein
MADKKFGRREFLKLTTAAVATQGLSHFRFLNFGGLGVASAKEEPDDCLATITGVCVTGDVCAPTGGQDICDPPSAPDICIAPNETDTCRAEPPQDPDICEPLPGDPDLCQPPPGDPDSCDPAVQESDVCDPPQFPEDTCDPQYPAESDVCLDVAGGYTAPDNCAPPGDPDECEPVGMPEDICDPPANPTDTSDVKLSSLGAKSSGGTFMGFVAALLAGVALWGKRRSKGDEFS